MAGWTLRWKQCILVVYHWLSSNEKVPFSHIQGQHALLGSHLKPIQTRSELATADVTMIRPKSRLTICLSIFSAALNLAFWKFRFLVHFHRRLLHYLETAHRPYCTWGRSDVCLYLSRDDRSHRSRLLDVLPVLMLVIWDLLHFD